MIPISLFIPFFLDVFPKEQVRVRVGDKRHIKTLKRISWLLDGWLVGK